MELPIDDLQPGDSPRTAGENDEYIGILAELRAPLPPILVNRRTMQVVDGMHRLRAAVARGETTISCRFCDVDESEAFALAVRCNVTHGMPLSLADRRAALIRILAMRPEWSNRKIAKIVGLAPGTVGAVRAKACDESGQPSTRVGQDGRVRPVDWSATRQRVVDRLREQPTSSLREIAALAGVSPSTVHAVKKYLEDDGTAQEGGAPDESGEPRRASPSPPRNAVIHAVTDERDAQTILRKLKEDPSLRYSETRRKIVASLNANLAFWTTCSDPAALVPSHCLEQVAVLASVTARYWDRLAEQLNRRQCDEMSATEGASARPDTAACGG